MTATLITVNNILNYSFGSRTYSPALPSYPFIGLSTTLVDATGLTSVTEPATANGYARFGSVLEITPTWTTATTNTITNLFTVTFPTASASWGTVLSLFIADSGTRAAGNVVWYSTLATPILVSASQILSFEPGDIVITM